MIRFFSIFLPFAPIIVGIALKASLIDEFEGTTEEKVELAKLAYFGSLWIDLTVTAYLMPISAYLSGVDFSKIVDRVLLVAPFVVLVICLVLALALPNIGITDQAVVLWAPLFVSAAWVVVAGLIITLSGREG
ncbi:MAG: hypothetical protein AB2692_19390 [Candidatus Thiodiazotropha sp.]